MSSKWSPTKVVRDHLGTLIDARTGRPRKSDYVSFFAVPAIGGVLAWLGGLRFESTDPLLSGTSIFTGLLFGVLVYVFNLRVRVNDSASAAGDIRLRNLIDELEANVSYTILVGLLLSGLVMALSATKKEDIPINSLSTAVTITLALHFALSVLLVLKRTRAAYARVTE